MDIINEKVLHRIFGEGTIKELNEKGIMLITFGDTEKKFLYPSSFESFLRFKNENIQKEVEKEIQIQKQEEQEKQRRETEEKERKAQKEKELKEKVQAYIKENEKAKRKAERAELRKLKKRKKAE